MLLACSWGAVDGERWRMCLESPPAAVLRHSLPDAGAPPRTRTGTPARAAGFEPTASANSASGACRCRRPWRRSGFILTWSPGAPAPAGSLPADRRLQVLVAFGGHHRGVVLGKVLRGGDRLIGAAQGDEALQQGAALLIVVRQLQPALVTGPGKGDVPAGEPFGVGSVGEHREQVDSVRVHVSGQVLGELVLGDHQVWGVAGELLGVVVLLEHRGIARCDEIGRAHV